MLDKYDIEKIKNGRFYSESKKCFVGIEDHIFKIGDLKIDLDKVLLTDKDTQDLLYNIIQESGTKQRIKKYKNYNGKVLLGLNSQGQKEWLAPPSWDCSWYWGFGYVQSKGSHKHFSGLVGQQEYYDHEKSCFRNGEYIHNIYNSPQLPETTFSEKEGWQLSELFKEFYLLKSMAEYTHRTPAGCHLTTSTVEQDNVKMKEWHEHINKVMIPKVTAEIMRILSPVEEVKI